MKHVFVRAAVVALVAAGSFTAFAADPTPAPGKHDTSPIPVCYQCGHPDGN